MQELDILTQRSFNEVQWVRWASTLAYFVVCLFVFSETQMETKKPWGALK